MIKKWNEKNTLEKVMDIISGVALCVWVIFEMLAKTNKVQYADVVCIIALCVVCICEAVSFWNTKRVFSYVAIGGTVLMLAVVVLQILLITQ